MNEEIKTIVGVISKKSSKPSKPDAVKPWLLRFFEIGGVTLTTFENSYDTFQENDVVEAEYTVKGEYKNIHSMKKSEALPPTTEATPVPPVQTAAPVKTAPYVDRGKETECSITSQTIIKAVAEMVSAGKIEPGSFKTNAANLVQVYKDTKKSLLE